MKFNLATQWKPAAWAFVGTAVACTLGALATDLSPWYYHLAKPTWQPPDWLFGPVWTIIFSLTAIAGFSAWQNTHDRAKRRFLRYALIVNLALNVLWSVLFFRLRRPDWALVEVVFLWLSIVLLIYAVWQCSRRASALIFPYLAWVSFAAFLNLTICRLNAPMVSF